MDSEDLTVRRRPGAAFPVASVGDNPLVYTERFEAMTLADATSGELRTAKSWIPCVRMCIGVAAIIMALVPVALVWRLHHGVHEWHCSHPYPDLPSDVTAGLEIDHPSLFHRITPGIDHNDVTISFICRTLLNAMYCDYPCASSSRVPDGDEINSRPICAS